MLWIVVVGGMLLASLIGGNLLRGGRLSQTMIDGTQNGPDAPADAFSHSQAGRYIDDEFKKPKY
jgi:hypothetical protein